jgi:hypothetical protein
MFSLRNALKGGVQQLTQTVLTGHRLTFAPVYSMAFMQLFERNKTPAELDHSFKRITKLKGHLKSAARKVYSNKLNTNVRV